MQHTDTKYYRFKKKKRHTYIANDIQSVYTFTKTAENKLKLNK